MSVPTITLGGTALMGYTGGKIAQTLRAISLPATVKLGRVEPPPEKKARVPMLYRYLSARVAVPDAVDYADKAMTSIGRMYVNDRLGCCVVSDTYHSVGVWSGNDDDTPGVV